MIDALSDTPPFIEVECEAIVGERIQPGAMVAFHPLSHHIVNAAWTGAVVAGRAAELLQQGEVARFNPYGGLFRKHGTVLVPTPVYECATCKDGSDIPNDDLECPDCKRTIF